MDYHAEKYFNTMIFPVYPVIGHFYSSEAYKKAVAEYYDKCSLHGREEAIVFERFKTDALKNAHLENHQNADKIFDFATEVAVLSGDKKLSRKTWNLLAQMVELFKMEVANA